MEGALGAVGRPFGALRFKDANGGKLLTSAGRRVPPLVDLPRLLSATNRIIDKKETDEDLQLILAPGRARGRPGCDRPDA